MLVMMSQNCAKAKDSLPKNTNVINGTGVRIIKSCSSNTKSSQVRPDLSLKRLKCHFGHIIWTITHAAYHMQE